MNLRAREVVGAAALVGLVSGAVGTAAQALGGGVQSELVGLIVIVGSIVGLAGGLLSGVLAWWLIRRRPPGAYEFADNAVLALTASLSAGILVYLLVFAAQSAQAPAIMIGAPAALISCTLLAFLRGGRRPRRDSRGWWLNSGLALVSAALGIVCVGWVVFVQTPASIGEGTTWETILATPQPSRQETVARLIGFISIVILAAIAVSVGVHATHLSRRASALAAATIPGAVALVHLSWLSQPSTSALVLLTQSESPSNAGAFVVQAGGWVIIVSWLINAWLRHPKVPSKQDHPPS